MLYQFPIPTIERNFFHVATFKNALSHSECNKVISIGDSCGWEEAKASKIARRQSKVSWLRWNSDDDWLWKRLATIASELNSQFFGFDLHSFSEHLQLTQYRAADDGHFDWHQDIGASKLSIRKLSFVVQLSDPSTYEGGQLEIFMEHQEEHQQPSSEQGSLILFPSYEPHRVTHITHGIRYSLVGWIIGMPFR